VIFGIIRILIKGFILDVDFTMLALGLFLLGITVMLYDFKKLLYSEHEKGTIRTKTMGTSLSIDEKGYTIITPTN